MSQGGGLHSACLVGQSLPLAVESEQGLHVYVTITVASVALCVGSLT